MQAAAIRSAILIGILCIFTGVRADYAVDHWQSTPWGYEGSVSLISGTAGPYGGDVQNLTIQVYFQSETISRIKIMDAAMERWQVPFVVQTPLPSSMPSQMDYDFSYTESPFSFAVTRKSDATVLFNSSNHFVVLFSDVLLCKTLLNLRNLLVRGSVHRAFHTIR